MVILYQLISTTTNDNLKSHTLFMIELEAILGIVGIIDPASIEPPSFLPFFSRSNSNTSSSNKDDVSNVVSSLGAFIVLCCEGLDDVLPTGRFPLPPA